MRGDWMDAPLRYDRSYVYRLYEPQDPAERTIVALHGSGADEAAILPLARMLDPKARIVAPRGRILQNGERRWYRKLSPITFDQSSVALEADTFSGFLDGLRRDGVTDPDRTLFLGYSNGANLVAATMLLHPGAIRQAVLMRAMSVLEAAPKADLTAARVLILSGATDQIYGSYGAMLGDLLKRNGAVVVQDTLSSGHECGEGDIAYARGWLDSVEGGVPATADAGGTRG
jgi:phospholipase/carboxylesterase